MTGLYFDVFSLLEIRKRKLRSHGKRKKGNDKRKRCTAQKSNTSFNNLLTKLREHGRHAMLSFLSSLPIPVLRIFDIEADSFYDRNHQMYEAALLTRCYTQHALHPLIDSEINHKRHFIKIPFINKGIDFITSSIPVTSSIPDYLQNFESPVICYKYNKPIRNIMFNFTIRKYHRFIGFQAIRLSTYDLSTLYTTLPHDLIKEKLVNFIEQTFYKKEGKLYRVCNAKKAFFTSADHYRGYHLWSCQNVYDALSVFGGKFYVRFGTKL